MKKSELVKLIKEEIKYVINQNIKEETKMKATLKLRNLIKEVLSEAKIYVQQGQPVPKGRKIEKGPRGGKFYTGSAAEKAAAEKGTSTSKTPSAPKKPTVNIFNKPSKQSTAANVPDTVKKQLQDSGKYFKNLVSIEQDTMGNEPESMVPAYKAAQSHINSRWPNAKVINTEDADDPDAVMDHIASLKHPKSVKKFKNSAGVDYKLTDYGDDGGVLTFNDGQSGDIDTLIVPRK